MNVHSLQPRRSWTLLSRGRYPHIEGSGPSNPYAYGFEGPRAVLSVWEEYIS